MAEIQSSSEPDKGFDAQAESISDPSKESINLSFFIQTHPLL